MTRAYLCGGIALVAGVLFAGCGLISSDVTNFDLSLPPKNFTIDTGRWTVDSTAATTFLGTDCSSNPGVCGSAVQLACPMGCTGTCNASQRCDFSLDVSLTQKVDLLAEKPELKSINDEPVIKVTIDSVTYEVTRNNLTVDTPELTIYVAPISVVKFDPSDSQIKAIGTIDPIPAGTVTSGQQPIHFTATGKAELINIMSTFKTPFNVLVGATINVTAGQAVPSGKLEAVVYIKGHAGL
ncbi:MAG TPA: hypothetical protein VFT22_29795 [Kofleriaceae bacterium]|nr:hypothetical protein [Kofleriaceae bacterium]